MKYVAVLEIDNDVILAGDSCCTSPQQLYQCLMETNTTEIQITRQFAEKFFTYEALCDFVQYTADMFPTVNVTVDETFYDTAAQSVNEILSYRIPAEFIYALEKDPHRVLSTISLMGKSYLSAREESAIANNKLATMLVQIENLQQELQFAHRDYEALLKRSCETEAALHALVSRVNYQYEKSVDLNSMFVAKHNAYNQILYIKEITRVHYVDTLIYYIREILHTLYNAPVRFVAIEPYYAYGRAELYKDCKPHWDLSYLDVYSSDIVMMGYQPKLMEDILKDPNHVNFLIILDRAGYMAPHVVGNNVATVYTASDLKDLPDKIANADGTYSPLDKQKVITYDNSTLYIPYVENFDNCSPEDRIQKYSSMNVTKQLIKYLEGVS